MQNVYTAKVELKNEQEVIYHDISKFKRYGTIQVTETTKKLLSRFNSWISTDKLNERADLELLGLCLYDLLFPPKSDIRDEFEGNYDLVTQHKGSRLRLTLVFHEEAGELANYPWEFLYLPPRARTPEKSKRDGFFLAGQKTDLILTRFLPDVEHVLGAKEKELRILIVFSNPQDDVNNLDDLNTKATKEAIETIRGLERPGSQVKVKLIENPTYQELKDAINEPEQQGEPAFKPHIVHFIGHGDKKLGLALQMTEDERNKRKKAMLPPLAFWGNRETICDLFADDPPPRLVFLHACEGAKSETLESFSDLARELAAAKIPAVVAMQYAISPDHAAAFAKVFYEELSKGKDVDEAVRKGREDLGQPIYGGRGTWSDRRFGTPVVYLQSETAIIEMPPKQDDLGYDPDTKVPCPNPNCNSKVLPGWAKCVVCGHLIMICPDCLKERRECQLIDKTIGVCPNCPYRAGVRSPVFSPSTVGTFGAPEAQLVAQAQTASPAALPSGPADPVINTPIARPNPDESTGLQQGLRSPGN